MLLLDMRPSTPLGQTSHDVFQANLVGEMLYFWFAVTFDFYYSQTRSRSHVGYNRVKFSSNDEFTFDLNINYTPL